MDRLIAQFADVLAARENTPGRTPTPRSTWWIPRMRIC